MDESRVGAALVVDVGTARTKAALFDVVEGVHRYVASGIAPTTLYGSHDDVSIGIRASIARIEQITGRRLLGTTGPITPQRSDGNGVDIFASTSSLGPQLRLLLLADDSNSSLAQLVKNTAAAHGANLKMFSDEKGKAPETLLDAIHDFDPHALLIVGEDKAGRSPFVAGIVETVSRELKRTGDSKPAILFVGGAGDSTTVSRSLKDRYELKIVSGAGEASSQGIGHRVGEELTKLWQENIIEEIPGYSLVISWQNQHVLPSSLSLAGALSFLSQYDQRNVISVDAGASTVSVFRIKEGGKEILVARDVGVGSESLIDSIHTVQSWLPNEISGEDLSNAIWNKWARPWAIPSTRSDALLEMACAVAAIRHALKDFPSALQFTPGPIRGLLVGAGGVFTGAARSETLLALLDGLELSGVFDVAVDRASILTQLGALAALDPQAAAEVVLNDGLHLLGTCLACAGTARQGSSAVRVDLKSRSGQVALKLDALFGDVKLIPPANLSEGEASVKVAAGLDAGWGKGKGGKMSFQPGLLGLLIDARGRPLRLPSSAEQTQAKRKEWLRAVGVSEARL